METAIKKAIEGGYKLPEMMEAYRAETIFGIPWWSYSVLDPAFWQCLMVGLGWNEKGDRKIKIIWPDGTCQSDYKTIMIKFMEHLSEEKDAESFFTNLLK